MSFNRTSLLMALVSAGIVFVSGTYFGVTIGSNQEKAAQLKKAQQSEQEAINQRNAVIASINKMAADNAQLNLKIDQWSDQYQQENQKLMQDMNREILNETTPNRSAYNCIIPAHGMRIRTEARRRAADAATPSRADASLSSAAHTKR